MSPSCTPWIYIPYSPDMAPADFFLFPRLKIALKNLISMTFWRIYDSTNDSCGFFFCEFLEAFQTVLAMYGEG